MTKRIIIEGPDGSGKSTIISHLIMAYPDQLHLEEGFKHSGEDDYPQWLMKTIYPDLDIVTTPVHNRLFYSELVYGPILRGHIDLSTAEIAMVKKKLQSEAFLIYCSLDFAQLVAHASQNEQMEGVMQNLRVIYHAYDDLMGEELPHYWPENRCASFNFKRDSTSKLVDQVGLYLEH